MTPPKSNNDAQLAIIWVHYDTPDLLLESINHVHADLTRSGLSGEAVVVENGDWDGDALKNSPMSAKFIRPGRNLGYAGGVNAGIEASAAPTILVMNPDVLVFAGCLPRLMTALQTYSIVGPSLFLDRDCLFRLPPNEHRDFVSVLIGALAEHSDYWAKYGRRRWRKHAHRFRRHTGYISGYELSGATLGFRRETWDFLGPWDDTYRLYFEETDWLNRAKRSSLPVACVAEARATHLFAQSAKQSPDAQKWFKQSCQIYETRHYNKLQRSLLKIARSFQPTRGTRPDSRTTDAYPTHAAWLELSSSRKGYPAAIAWIDCPPRYQEQFERFAAQQLPAGNYRVRWLDEYGKEITLNQFKIRV